MREVVAEQLRSVVGAKAREEGDWNVWVDNPPRPIVAQLVPNGDHAFDRWIVAAYDRVLQRRFGGSGPSHAHALFEIVEGVRLYRAGAAPLVAVAGDPRVEEEKPKIVPPVGNVEASTTAAPRVSVVVEDRGSTPRPTSAKPAARRAAAKKRTPSAR